MVSKTKIKLLNSLKQKKYRQKYNLFIAEGHKIFRTVMNSETYHLDEVICTPEWFELYAHELGDIEYHIGTLSDINGISNLNSKPNVLSIVKMPDVIVKDTNYKKVIYLDNVQDPGNVGTIIRTADWFGVNAVIRSLDSADFYNQKVVQSTMGSFANMELYTMSKPDFIDFSSTYDVFASDMSGQDYKDIRTAQPCCLILSNEGTGLSSLLRPAITNILTISAANSNAADSLNVGIAGGILMSHLFG